MRYTIGAQVYDRNKKEWINGYYVLGSYGLPYVFSSKIDANNRHVHFVVFEDLDEAKMYITDLSHSYRKEFLSCAKKYSVEKSKFRFYLQKFDSLNFSSKYKVAEEIKNLGSLKRYNSAKIYRVDNA